MLNSLCNARCSYCYISYKGARDPKEALLTTRRLMSIGFKVTFSGSENLLDLRYLDCFKEAGQDYILSNGIILAQNPGIIQILKEKGISEVMISHNFDAGNRSITDSTLKDALSNSLNEGLSICISTLISARNYQDIHEFCRKAKSMGASRIRFFRYLQIGNAGLGESMVLNAEQESSFFELLDEVRQDYLKEDLEINLAAGFRPRPKSRGEALAKENRFCPAGRTLFVLTPDNSIYGCPFTIGEGQEIGKLTPEGLEIFRDIGDGRRDTCLALEK
jgi:MoaA/NifB/PqqE/SkfB family radical SAM enzyme